MGRSNQSSSTPTSGSKPASSFINPFRGDTHEVSWYNVLQIILTTVTLVLPVRFLLLVANFAINCILFGLISLGAPPNTNERDVPLSSFRRFLVSLLRGFSPRLHLWLAGFYWINVKGSLSKEVCQHLPFFSPSRRSRPPSWFPTTCRSSKASCTLFTGPLASPRPL